MSKAALCFAALLLAGCSREDREQTKADAAKLGQDLKHDVKKADAVVTKELKDAQQHIKRDVDKAKQ